MYSNFITPPDFVNEEKHTVTVVNATEDDVEMLGRMAQVSDEEYNIYLYHNGMNDTTWLDSAINLSDAIVVNINQPGWDHICNNNKTYYYGDRTLLSPSLKITSAVDYFALRIAK